ncbi:cell wall metabolism sensor histidine kinase WalK [uncultured Porphyromonas sp.]|uniref:sensor histidine kinase n=1 Tax=uncultured Porphyromonas sp. TaxID=159274 RepID=UPI00261B65AC|nr:HAMP domain-containing sensor histidine kinase [uncultured Porphyromonas sp.]
MSGSTSLPTKRSYGLHFVLTLLCLALTLLCWSKYRDASFAEKQHLRESSNTLATYADLIAQSHHTLPVDDLFALLPDGIEAELVDSSLRITAATDTTRVGRQLTLTEDPELRLAYYNHSGDHLSPTEESDTADGQLHYALYCDGHYIHLTRPYREQPATDRKMLWLACLLPSLLILLGMLVGTFLSLRATDRSVSGLRRLTAALRRGEHMEGPLFADDDIGTLGEELRRLFSESEATVQRTEEMRQHLIALFDLSKIGIALFDSSGTTLFANTHFIQFASMISSRALPLESLSELLTEESMQPIGDFIASSPGGEERSRRAMIPSGSHIFEVKAFRSASETFDLTIEDVTVSVQTAQLKREMTSNITHEIRTPLTSIRGYLETLRYSDLSPEQQAAFTDKAYRQAERLSAMMDDIRLISQMDEREAEEYRMEELDLGLIVEEARIAFADRIEQSGDRFVNEIPDGLTIHANNSLIHSVFQNLIENSLRYAGDGVTLCFSCYHRDDEYVYLSYYDTGRGVPEEKLGRIFERFYRIDSGRTRDRGGSGLGLSIVRNAIRLHGGQIQARRHCPEGGLEFLFTLHK